MKSPALWLILCGATALSAQAPDGRAVYQARCSGCHGIDGNGGEHAPTVLPTLATKNDGEVATIIREGVPRKGMPGFKQLPDAEVQSLVAFLRTLQQARRGRRATAVRLDVKLTDGTSLAGLAIARTSRELQLRTDDQRLHLLRKSGDQYRRVTSQANWPSLHGDFSGNRYSPLSQITPANAHKLAVKC